MRTIVQNGETVCEKCGTKVSTYDGGDKFFFLCKECIEESICELLEASYVDRSYHWPEWIIEGLKQIHPQLPVKDISGHTYELSEVTCT
jgi:hypothetical protein